MTQLIKPLALLSSSSSSISPSNDSNLGTYQSDASHDSSDHHHHYDTYPCFISICSCYTTSAALSTTLIPILNACFPPSVNQTAFNDKHSIHLCRAHREQFQLYRETLLYKQTQQHTQHHTYKPTTTAATTTASAAYQPRASASASHTDEEMEPLVDDSDESHHQSMILMLDMPVVMVSCVRDSISHRNPLSIGGLIIAGLVSLSVLYMLLRHIL